MNTIKENWLHKNLNFTNLLILIVGVLITAFFVDFDRWKAETRTWRTDVEKRLNLVEQGIILHDYQIKEIQKDIEKLWGEKYGTTRSGKKVSE